MNENEKWICIEISQKNYNRLMEYKDYENMSYNDILEHALDMLENFMMNTY